ncbi:hypothetical protein M422DRAFT_207697 [Sphaerobolus stellatus SS14]|uniref:4-hydroxybenzoate polyprenyltransferase, mitochondrial n=1 Tax=Sphaerobolus stellatus (strain SS14) TaxID=990650 RepID=A0A0C9UQ25_SPHS4|nr:hypothetical protein M422DRAFT_207697 [Sphaerobolus stellatus SS14]
MTSSKIKTIGTGPPKPRLWEDSVPLLWKPFVQLTRIDLFVGSLMIFWPCVWGLTLGDRSIHPAIYLKQLPIWLVWSILLHSVGSTWNDICDIDFDRQVERTKSRPLPSGTISIRAAVILMIPQIAILFGILYSFNSLTVYMGLIELCLFTPLYPFMKRITFLPQVWLGMAFTWGAVISWVANAEPQWQTLTIVLGAGTVWTTYSDTFYAMLDKKDDPGAGVKSTALLFGNHARIIQTGLASSFVLGLTAIGWVSNLSIGFYLVSVLGTAIHMTWQVYTVDFDDPTSCMSRFLSNGGQLGYMIWFGLLVDYLSYSSYVSSLFSAMF